MLKESQKSKQKILIPVVKGDIITHRIDTDKEYKKRLKQLAFEEKYPKQ